MTAHEPNPDQRLTADRAAAVMKQPEPSAFTRISILFHRVKIASAAMKTTTPFEPDELAHQVMAILGIPEAEHRDYEPDQPARPVEYREGLTWGWYRDRDGVTRHAGMDGHDDPAEAEQLARKYAGAPGYRLVYRFPGGEWLDDFTDKPPVEEHPVTVQMRKDIKARERYADAVLDNQPQAGGQIVRGRIVQADQEWLVERFDQIEEMITSQRQDDIGQQQAISNAYDQGHERGRAEGKAEQAKDCLMDHQAIRHEVFERGRQQGDADRAARGQTEFERGRASVSNLPSDIDRIRQEEFKRGRTIGRSERETELLEAGWTPQARGDLINAGWTPPGGVIIGLEESREDLIEAGWTPPGAVTEFDPRMGIDAVYQRLDGIQITLNSVLERDASAVHHVGDPPVVEAHHPF